MTAQPWDADQDLSPERVRALLHRRFPSLGLGADGRAGQAQGERVEGVQPAGEIGLEKLGEGWDNAAWLVQQAGATPLVFRLPRRALAADLLSTEARALPVLARHLGVPISAPTHHTPALLGAAAVDDYPYPVAGYPLLAGTTLDRAALPPPQRRTLAATLGRTLRTLHRFPPAQAEALGVPGDTLQRANLALQAQRIRERIDALAQAHQTETAAQLTQALAWALADLAAATSVGGPAPDASVVHGDLYARHLLVGPALAPESAHDQPDLAGIIDWGDLHRGDVALDLAVLYAAFDATGVAAFEVEYGRIEPEVAARARLLALRSISALLLYGHSVGDMILWQEAGQGLGLWAAGPPPAARTLTAPTLIRGGPP